MVRPFGDWQIVQNCFPTAFVLVSKSWIDTFFAFRLHTMSIAMLLALNAMSTQIPGKKALTRRDATLCFYTQFSSFVYTHKTCTYVETQAKAALGWYPRHWHDKFVCFYSVSLYRWKNSCFTCVHRNYSNDNFYMRNVRYTLKTLNPKRKMCTRFFSYLNARSR